MVTALKKFLGLESCLFPFASILLSGGKPLHKKFDNLISAGSRLDWNQKAEASQKGAWENQTDLELVSPPFPSGSRHWPYRLGTCDGISIHPHLSTCQPLAFALGIPTPDTGLLARILQPSPKSYPQPCSTAKIKTHFQKAY